MAYDNSRGPNTDDFMFDMDDDPFDDDRLGSPGSRRADYQGGYRDDRYDDGYRDDRYRDGYRDDRYDDGYRDDRYDDGYRDDRYDDGYRDDRYDNGYRDDRYDDGYRDDRRRDRYADDSRDDTEFDEFEDPFGDDDPFDEFGDEPFSDEDDFDDEPEDTPAPEPAPRQKPASKPKPAPKPNPAPAPEPQAGPSPKPAATMPADARPAAPPASEASKAEQPRRTSLLGGTVAFALSQLEERQRMISGGRHDISVEPEPAPAPMPEPKSRPESTGTATLDRPRANRTETPEGIGVLDRMASGIESRAEAAARGREAEPLPTESQAWDTDDAHNAQKPDYADDESDDFGDDWIFGGSADASEPEDDFGDDLQNPMDDEPEDDFGDDLPKSMDDESEDDFGDWTSEERPSRMTHSPVNPSRNVGVAPDASGTAVSETAPATPPMTDETYYDPFGQNETIVPGSRVAAAPEPATPTHDWGVGQVSATEPDAGTADEEVSALIEEPVTIPEDIAADEEVPDENGEETAAEPDMEMPTIPTDEDGWPVEGIGLKVPKPRLGNSPMKASMVGTVLLATMEDVPSDEVHAYVEQLASLGFSHGRVDDHGANGGYVFAATDSNTAGGATVMVSRHFDGFVRIFANEGWGGEGE